MRELDVVLTAYFDQDYAASCEVDKRAFRELLALPDPDLNAYLLGPTTPANPEIAHVVALVRSKAMS
jgi:succinate dehydrogenase flavin-adding protein (antitoxin of CptAB toxin-antitoxin module)